MYNRNNTYLHPSTSVVGLNANEILLHHHGHIDFHSGNHYLTGLGATNTPVLDASTLFNDINGLNGDHPSTMSTFPRNQKAAKKDRHSKINTAQGPRDRRVRLSIGIARKFFDLQEMLGFDKPSKTLDWLLTKSKSAIKDLVQMKSCKSTNSTSGGPSDCHEEVESLPNDSKGKSVLMNGNKVNLAKESRAKARARARERTKEKMCIKAQLNEATRYKGNYQYQYEVSGSREPILHCPLSYEEATITTQEELIQESIVIKRRFKQLHPQIFGFNGQQNLNVSTANGNENWDYSNFSTSQSNNQLCAILDHHKFIN